MFSIQKIVYFICHCKKFLLYSCPEFWKTFLGFFCCCQNVVPKYRASNRNSIPTFFQFQGWYLEVMSREICWIGVGGLQNFVRIMAGAVLFSTRCMNMMLLQMFNWYIFKMFGSLKISLVCTNLFLLKIIRIACFCWLLIFLRFVLQVQPQAILA